MMIASKATGRIILALAALATSVLALPVGALAQSGSQIVATVNRAPITNSDVARRAAFLRLQRQKADTKTARESLVEEQLKRQEILRVRASVSTEEVDQAFARFAASNKLSTAQMTQILGQAGVGVEHFKNFIAVQMSWPRLVNSRYGGRSKMSSQDLVTRMMENKEKPVTTEYFLKQVVFVVPANKRNIVGKRQAEANASRSKFPGCDQAKEFAANYLDVSIRDLGRVLEPELPDNWKPLIKKASGGTTGTLVTERGIEYLAICNQRQVSDDHAAEVVFRAEDIGKELKGGQNPNEKKYLDELRSKALIDYR